MSVFYLNNKELAFYSKMSPSLAKLLANALNPVGRCSYIFGGQWFEKTKWRYEVRSLGVPEEWKIFYDSQDSSYDYQDHKYKADMGLDCSGYVAWTIHNTFFLFMEDSNSLTFAQDMAKFYSKRDFGECIAYEKNSKLIPGDIVSMPNDNHVYIALDTFPDGSILVLHSTAPDGPTIMGTCTPSGEKSEAIEVATIIMTQYFPEAQEKFSIRERGMAYFNSEFLRWDPKILPDPDGIRDMGWQEMFTFMENKISEIRLNASKSNLPPSQFDFDQRTPEILLKMSEPEQLEQKPEQKFFPFQTQLTLDQKTSQTSTDLKK